MKTLIAALLALYTANASATAEEVLAAVVLGQVVHDIRESQKPNRWGHQQGGNAVIGYPVPVYQPQVIVVPQCTANYACPTPILQCDTLPVVDQWGRIISYQKTCR